MQIKRNSIVILMKAFAAITILLVIVAISQIKITPDNEREKSRKAEISLNNHKELVDRKLKQLSEGPTEKILKILANKEFNNLSVSYFIFEYDSLIFWSDNQIPIPNSIELLESTAPVILIGNSYVLQRKLEKDSYTYIALYHIKNDYVIKNRFLSNDFNKDLKLPKGSGISFSKNGNDVYIDKQEYAFSIIFPDNMTFSDEATLLILITLFLLFLFVSREAYRFIYYWNYTSKKPNYALILFWSVLIVIRIISLYWNEPAILYKTNLFSPSELAFSLIAPSLGDLFINSNILLIISWGYYRYFKIPNEVILTRITRGSLFLFSIALSFFIIALNTWLINNIVLNSSFTLDLRNVSELSELSLLGYFIITITTLSAFLIIHKSLKELIIIIGRKEILILTMFFLLISIFTTSIDLISINETVVIFGLILYFSYFKSISGSLGHIIKPVMVLIFFSFYLSCVLNSSLKEKELEARKLFAINISQNRDMLKEFDLFNIKQSFNKDSILNTLLKNRVFSDGFANEISNYLRLAYFHDYLANYHILITICNDDTELNVQTANLVINCKKYFFEYILRNCQKTDYENIYYQFPGNDYIIIYDTNTIPKRNEDGLIIVVELAQRYSGYELGYPELLEDKDDKHHHNIYSHALYRNNKLITSRGKYTYQDIFDFITEDIAIFQLIRSSNYSHLIYRANDTDSVVVSLEEGNNLRRITHFSFLMLLYGIAGSIIGLIKNIYINYRKTYSGFREKIQMLFLGLILLTFLSIGFFFIGYIQKLFVNRNNAELKERSLSILVELEHKLLSQNQERNLNQDYLNELLEKFSNVFFTDINLYNSNGSLIATSRPALFDKGYRSTRMDPVAYYKLVDDNETIWIQEERIGQYQYLSSYLKLKDSENDLIAIINVPYFAKQSELKREISDFLISFTNIYIILMIIGLILSLILSNFLLQPLNRLRNNLERLKLTETNEMIELEGSDEIGLLIKEYNRKVKELEESVTLLSRTERESAWKEMAMQIAHEIKNSLTPMKLNIQQLKRELNDHDKLDKTRIDQFSQSMINQIDSLTEIAAAFSSFASFPQAELKEVNLINIILEAINPYNKEINIEFLFTPLLKNKCLIISDEKQLIRALDNLIQNAIHAIQNHESGKIVIELKELSEFWSINIIDNGIGIKDSDQKKLFQPHFTTKSTGKGLGLAIVNKTITEYGGTISYESEYGKGTSFNVRLPKLK